MKLLILSLVGGLGLLAQVPSNPDELVTVPKKYVNAEHLNQAQTQTQVSHYIGIGKEIGEAVKNGLESVVDVSNKFANTPVGHFTMAMIAWKILGRDLLHVVIGIPLYLMLLTIWFYFVRRLFLGRWVKRYVDGKRQHVFEEPVRFETRDGRGLMGTVLIFFGLLINVVFIVIIF